MRMGKSIETILEILESFPMDVQHKDKFGCYPLHYALNYVHTMDIVMKLIEMYPEAAQHPNDNGQHPLYVAIRFHFTLDIVLKLIKVFPDAAQHKDSRGLYPLHFAMTYRYKSEASLMKLIEISPKAVFASPKSGTALYYACKHESEAVIKKLIEINPQAILENKSDDTDTDPIHCTIHCTYPIHCAIWNHQPISVIKLLLDGDSLGMERRATGRAWDYETPLHLALRIDNAGLVKYLMKRSGIRLNVRDGCGETPIHYACCFSQCSILDLLLHHPNVDVNATDILNETPLHKIVRSHPCNPVGYANMLEKFLDHPCILINEKNINDKTPLDLIKAYLDDVENIREDTRAEEVQYGMKMIHLLEEYPIKKRWKAYCYHVESFIGL